MLHTNFDAFFMQSAKMDA